MHVFRKTYIHTIITHNLSKLSHACSFLFSLPQPTVVSSVNDFLMGVVQHLLFPPQCFGFNSIKSICLLHISSIAHD